MPGRAAGERVGAAVHGPADGVPAGESASDADGRWRRFDSSRIDVRMRTPAWERLTRDLLLPLRLDAPAGPILGTIAGRRTGRVRQLALKASAHFGVRTTQLATGVGSDHCSIAFATAGSVEVRQYGRRAVLAPGECAVYDTSDAFAVGSRLAFGAHIVMFPNDLLRLPQGHLAQIVARAVDGSLASRIRAAVASWTEAPDDTAEELSELFGTVGSAYRDVPGGSRTNQEIVAAVQRMIATRLDDPRLTPDFVAGVLGISRRRLYYACAERIGPFAGYVRARRLEHAAALLRDPSSARLTVTEVARRSGFADLAHFSRLFAQTYGVPATAWRARPSLDLSWGGGVALRVALCRLFGSPFCRWVGRSGRRVARGGRRFHWPVVVLSGRDWCVRAGQVTRRTVFRRAIPAVMTAT